MIPPPNPQNSALLYNPQYIGINTYKIQPPLYTPTPSINQTPTSKPLPPLSKPRASKKPRAKKAYQSWACTSIQSCKALPVVVTCLKHWHLCEDTGCLKNIFGALSKDNKYMHLVDAYHHLLCVHLSGKNSEDQYNYINRQIRKVLYCNFINCKSYTRNQRERKKEAVGDDKVFIFLRDLLDTIHAYLVHGYDSGHRYRKDTQPAKVAQQREEADDDEKEECKKDPEDMDGLVDDEIKALQAWQASIKQLQRNQDKNAKFQSKINEIKHKCPDQTISLALLKAKFGHDPTFQLWMQYLLKNEYDTDAVLEQLADSANAVIYDHFKLAEKDKTIFFNKIKQYIQEKQVDKKEEPEKTDVYSLGIPLYYWDYHKTSDKKDTYHHPGLRYKDLYVPPAYLSFKSELLAKGIPITQWHQKMYEAGAMLSLSPTLKRIRAYIHKYSLCTKYGIRGNSSFRVYHMLAVLFYANFTSLCADFSTTFRYLSQKESLQDLIKRGAQWHFLAKYLREAVEVFGEKIGMDYRYKCIEKGSFYHAVPYLCFSGCRLSFYGPLSTSKQLEVLTLFADKQGLVVELQSCQAWDEQFLKFFNVSLVSCFAAEDERLFIGGQYPLKIASIRLLKQNMNTQPLIHTLHVVHKMIVGAQLEGSQACAKDISIFKQLLSHSSNLPFYIHQIWNKFRHRQKSIKMNIGYMYAYYSRFIPLLLSSDPAYKHVLLLDKLVKIFPNITEILCASTDNINGGWKVKSYSDTVVKSSFVQGIKDCLSKMQQHKTHKLQKITIKTYKYKIADDCKLYARQFRPLGWYIGKGPSILEVTKYPYKNCMEKLSLMIQGVHSVYEVTSLDKTILSKLLVGGKDLPPDMQHTWEAFRYSWYKVKINIRYMYKYYRLFIPLLCSSELKYKNLLFFNKIANIFPNATKIICTATNNITGGAREEDLLPTIISVNFMLGLLDTLRAIDRQTKLKKIIIKVSWTSQIKDDCISYAPQFGNLGWLVGKGNHTILLKKRLYDDFKEDFMDKISAMIAGEPPPCEITTLDITLLQQLIAHTNDVPLHVQQTWTDFALAQQSIQINMKCMKKQYKALNSILLSKDINNLLLLDKMSELFPNATQIVCYNTNCIIIKEHSWIESFSPLVVGVLFMLGLQDRLGKIPKHTKLKKIILTTSVHQINVDCNLYATQFEILGWRVAKENRKNGRKVKGSIILTRLFVKNQDDILSQ